MNDPLNPGTKEAADARAADIAAGRPHAAAPGPGWVLVSDKVERQALIRQAKAVAIANALPEDRRPKEMPAPPAAVCLYGHWWRPA